MGLDVGEPFVMVTNIK